jgi:pimeloyl-ACP methyl ester carboxylesterase
VLAHGAGSGPWIFAGWKESIPGVEVVAVDLQAGLEVARASMDDYARRVVETADRLPRPVVLCGWSMGGLAVLMAVARVRPRGVVLIEPSPPAEAQGLDEAVEPAPGVFDPEEVYGAFPPGVRARPESLLARGERKRGIGVPELPCPSLVVYGDEFRDDRGRAVAAVYGSAELDLPGLDHWALVTDPRVRAAVARFVAAG